MTHIFEQYYSCECGCDSVRVHPQYDNGERWVTLAEIEKDPSLKKRDPRGQRLVYICDYTNITCTKCNKRMSEEQFRSILYTIPKIKEWTYKEEVGLCIINSYALDKVSINPDEEVVTIEELEKLKQNG